MHLYYDTASDRTLITKNTIAEALEYHLTGDESTLNIDMDLG
jgi:hypothetical protein